MILRVWFLLTSTAGVGDWCYFLLLFLHYYYYNIVG